MENIDLNKAVIVDQSKWLFDGKLASRIYKLGNKYFTVVVEYPNNLWMNTCKEISQDEIQEYINFSK